MPLDYDRFPPAVGQTFLRQHEMPSGDVFPVFRETVRARGITVFARFVLRNGIGSAAGAYGSRFVFRRRCAC